jgi:hypothetical protein
MARDAHVRWEPQEEGVMKPMFPLYLALRVPQQCEVGVMISTIKLFFWRRFRGERGFLQGGVSHLQSLYFVIVLLSLFYFVLFSSLYKNRQKYFLL